MDKHTLKAVTVSGVGIAGVVIVVVCQALNHPVPDVAVWMIVAAASYLVGAITTNGNGPKRTSGGG